MKINKKQRIIHIGQDQDLKKKKNKKYLKKNNHTKRINNKNQIEKPIIKNLKKKKTKEVTPLKIKNWINNNNK